MVLICNIREEHRKTVKRISLSLTERRLESERVLTNTGLFGSLNVVKTEYEADAMSKDFLDGNTDIQFG